MYEHCVTTVLGVTGNTSKALRLSTNIERTESVHFQSIRQKSFISEMKSSKFIKVLSWYLDLKSKGHSDGIWQISNIELSDTSLNTCGTTEYTSRA